MLDPLGGLGGVLHAALPAHLRLRPATPFDALPLSRDLRLADSAELFAWGCTPVDGLALSIGAACEVWAVEGPGGVVAVFGVREVSPGVGHPWLLTGKAALSTPKGILGTAKAFIDRWAKRWPLLVTWSWMGNPGHHRWLRHHGFTPINIVPTGAFDALTLEFVRISPHGP